MSAEDDFDLGELARALDRATPRPNPARRTADLRLAQEVFDRMHGVAQAPAPASAHPAPVPRGRWAALLGGWGGRGALTASTAVVAGVFLVATPVGRSLLDQPFADRETDRAPPSLGESGPALAAAPEADTAPDPAASSRVAEAAPAPAATVMVEAEAPPEAEAASAPEAATPAAPEAEAESYATATADAAVTAAPAGDEISAAEIAPAPAPAPVQDAAPEALARTEELPAAAVPEPQASVMAEAAPEAEAPPEAQEDTAAALVADAAPALAADVPTAPPPEEAARLTEAAPEAAAPSTGGDAVVALAPIERIGDAEAARPIPEVAERDLDNLAAGLVAAAPEAGGGAAPEAEREAAAAAALVAERVPARSAAEASVAQVEPGPPTGFWAELSGALRAGALPPPATVRVGEILAAVPPARAGAAGALGVTVLPAPWDPFQRIVLVSLPADWRGDAEELRLRAEWDGVASWRLLGSGVPDQSGGPQFLAAFEVTPVALGAGGGLGALRLGWKSVDGRGVLAAPIPAETPVAPEARFAAALAGWGLLLRGEELGAWGQDEALALAQANRGKDGAPGRAEALELLRISAGLPTSP